MMKAIQMSRFGGPEVFELVEIPIPEPGPRFSCPISWFVFLRIALADVQIDVGAAMSRKALQALAFSN
jgi:hypothetical protein